MQIRMVCILFMCVLQSLNAATIILLKEKASLWPEMAQELGACSTWSMENMQFTSAFTASMISNI